MKLTYLDTIEQRNKQYRDSIAGQALQEIKYAKSSIAFVEALARGDVPDPESRARAIVTEANVPDGAQKTLF